MKICPQCTSTDVPDKASKCPFCGYCFNIHKEVNITKQKLDQESESDEETEEKGGSADNKKKSIFIIAAVVVCVCLIVAVFVLKKPDLNDKKSNKVNKPNKETESVDAPVEEMVTTSDENQESSKENSEENVQENVSAADMQRMEELKAASIQMEGIMEWDSILEETSALLSANETNSEIKTLSVMIFDEFYQNSLEYIDMIKGIEDFKADMYQECTIRFNELDKWNEILNSGYDEKIAGDRELCKNEYENKFVNLFDKRCEETVTENGVISRTVAWEIMKGLENTDLYNANSEGDPEYRYNALRLRYIVAKVLKIQKEVSSMSREEAINTIKGAMVECDYDPMLVYLLMIYEYEPSTTWIYEIDYMLSDYLNGASYINLTDADRLNFVYLYNVDSQSYKECKEKVIKYMRNYYY